MWYVIGGIVVVIILGWVAVRMMGVGAMYGAGVDTDRNIDGSTTYTNGEGSVTVGSQSMPENWPSDAPNNYAGATITFSGSSNPQTGQPGSAVSYMVRASAQAVIDHYKSELAANGWAIQGSANAAGAMVITATKGTRVFGAWVADNGGGSATVTAGIQM